MTAIRGLTELFSARARECARGEDYVAVAQNALEAGFDTPATLKLAIEEPPFFTPDLDRQFVEMLAECGIPEPDLDTALIEHARLIAAEIVSGRIEPKIGVEKIGEIFTFHYTPAGYHGWSVTTESLDCEYCRDEVMRENPQARSYEAALIAEAERLLHLTAATTPPASQ